ncbi:TPA: hypothetical protein N0F65_005447, partial [Lagenidium giganteum]
FFSSWREFHSQLEPFSEKTWQLFSLGTCKTVVACNHQIETRVGHKPSKSRPLPTEWIHYSKTLLCTHGMPNKSRDSDVRHYNVVRDIGCLARINATLVGTKNGDNRIHVNVIVGHNNARNAILHEHYVVRRRVVDPELLQEAENMMLAGAKSRGIRKYLKEQTGKKVTLKDVHDFKTRCKRKASRDKSLSSGNAATVLVNDSNVLQTLVFQTKAMKKNFAAFSEVLFVDSTFGTNANNHSLHGFSCQDLFGKGEYVQMAEPKNEMIENLNDACSNCKLNPASKNVRVVVTDKDETLIRLLKTHFQKARFLLCQFHVIQWSRCPMVPLKKSRNQSDHGIFGDESDYLASRRLLLRMYDNNEEHNLFSYFPYINSPQTCPNRLESRWRKLKDIIQPYGRMDDCIKTLFLLLQDCVAQYIASLGKINRRAVPAGEFDDAELQQLAGALSVYAYKLVVPEYKIGIGSIDYMVRPIGNGQFEIGHEVPGEKYVMQLLVLEDSVATVSTRVLSAQDGETQGKYESVIPFMTLPARWSLRASPTDITDGEITSTGFATQQASKPIADVVRIWDIAEFEHIENSLTDLMEMVLKGGCSDREQTRSPAPTNISDEKPPTVPTPPSRRRTLRLRKLSKDEESKGAAPAESKKAAPAESKKAAPAESKHSAPGDSPSCVSTFTLAAASQKPSRRKKS